jgi:hypothetical protein
VFAKSRFLAVSGRERSVPAHRMRIELIEEAAA